MKIILVIILLLSSITSFACDNCNIFLNISPNDYKNSFGMYYHTRHMYGKYNLLGQVKLKHAGVEETNSLLSKEVNDLYHSYELRGAFYWRLKWKTMFTLPVTDNTQKIDGLAKYRVKGIADPIIMQTYQLYNTNTKMCVDSIDNITHRVTIGGGVKVPLGSIDKTYPYGKPNIDLQPGTGSWDFIFLTTYAFKFNNVGFTSNLNIKFNTFNKDNFKYGNTLNFNANVFYMKELTNIVVMPFVGGYIEKFGKDYEELAINDSGGATFFGNIGLKLYKGPWSLNAQYQKVLSTQLNGNTQLFTIYRTTVGLNYNF